MTRPFFLEKGFENLKKERRVKLVQTSQFSWGREFAGQSRLVDPDLQPIVVLESSIIDCAEIVSVSPNRHGLAVLSVKSDKFVA